MLCPAAIKSWLSSVMAMLSSCSSICWFLESFSGHVSVSGLKTQGHWYLKHVGLPSDPCSRTVSTFVWFVHLCFATEDTGFAYEAMKYSHVYVCTCTSPVLLPAELADGGINRRRSSGRVRSGKDDDIKNHHGGASLYTVVTMDPDDEVMS